MSFFPFDNNEDDEDFDFEGDITELVKTFENKEKDSFTASELLSLFRFYTFNPDSDTSEQYSDKIKQILAQGIQQFPYMEVFAIHMAEMCLAEGKNLLAKQYINEALTYNALDPILNLYIAIILSKDGKKNKAIAKLNEILELAIPDSEVLEDLLEILILGEQFELVDVLFTRCLDAKIELDPFIDQLFFTALDSSHVPVVLKIIENAIDHRPYNADLWYILGNLFMDLENHAKAEWAYDYAYTLKPALNEAILGLLESKYEQEKYEEFISFYKETVHQLNTEEIQQIQGLYAWSLYENGQLKESQVTYRKLLAQHPTDFESWYSYGLTYHYQELYGMAIPFILKAFTNKPLEVDYGLVLAAAYFGNLEYPKAQAIYEQLVVNFKENEELYLDWITLEYEIGNTNKALEITQKGLAVNPASVPLLYRLVALCYILNLKTEAETVLNFVLQIDPLEHKLMFNFAPKLKKSSFILNIISKYTTPLID